ncbi:hypothetical protein chiPu_0016761 [Chiloscyllium punctatum]|uniref:Uncharacterized protein n=1 Tax=Chiloscyllium punctatum TaxID=137246 RepID=A0A401T6H3_CHIPU|nr:hypothetical protein [Chiloscyllium punctatum]
MGGSLPALISSELNFLSVPPHKPKRSEEAGLAISPPHIHSKLHREKEEGKQRERNKRLLTKLDVSKQREGGVFPRSAAFYGVIQIPAPYYHDHRITPFLPGPWINVHDFRENTMELDYKWRFLWLITVHLQLPGEPEPQQAKDEELMRLPGIRFLFHCNDPSSKAMSRN